MNRRILMSTVIALFVFLLAAAGLAAMDEATPGSASSDVFVVQGQAQAAVNPANFTTIITVTTTDDPINDSLSRTCGYTSGAVYFPDTPCSLRRAIVEASARPSTDRPILIAFDIPTTDPNYDAATKTWTVKVGNTLHPLTRKNTLDKNGDVTIDGATQPGGRATGPKVFVDSNYSLEVESTGNTIRNLGWRGGGVIFLKNKANGNVVENVWMGLTVDGQNIDFFDTNNRIQLAGGGIVVASNNNIVRNNVVAGSHSRAISIDGGDDNEISNNFIGTRADGTVPTVAQSIECQRSLSYDPSNWYGGWGISLSGSRNAIHDNTIAGLHQIQTANETPPMAIEIFGNNHTIQNNIIGVDSASSEVGVCGQGIKASGHDTRILNNTIVKSKGGFETTSHSVMNDAILLSDSSPTFGQITIRGNIIRQGPGKVIEMGPSIPRTLRLFKPAKITSISGTTVQGTSGDGSSCPNCLIDLYLDDLDSTEEALQVLASVTADGSGNFTAALTQTLPAGFGIRTGSTTQSSGVIGSFGAGTSTELSELYTAGVAPTGITISGPTEGVVNTSYAFTVNVSPAGATKPITYEVQITDRSTPLVVSLSSNTATASNIKWQTAGTKTLDVTATNAAGTVHKVHTIVISEQVDTTNYIYLPTVLR